MGGWAGHEPTARTNCRCLLDAQRPRLFSLHRDHGGSGDTAAIKASRQCKCPWQCRLRPLIAAAAAMFHSERRSFDGHSPCCCAIKGSHRHHRCKCPRQCRQRPLIAAAAAMLHVGCRPPPPAPFDRRSPCHCAIKGSHCRRKYPRRCRQRPLIAAARRLPCNTVSVALAIKGSHQHMCLRRCRRRRVMTSDRVVRIF